MTTNSFATFTDEELSIVLAQLRQQLAFNEYNDVHSDYIAERKQLEEQILLVQHERERRGLL